MIGPAPLHAVSTFTLPPGLARHAPQLWCTVAELCRAGFTVDPYEARVLFVDFGIEAWDALAHHGPLAGAAPHSAAFEHALARHFYNYAAACLAPLGAAGWRLRDLQTTMLQTPRTTASSNWQVLAEALLSLSEADVQRLLAFRAYGLPCEWHLAAVQNCTILRARESVTAAVARWVEAACVIDPHGDGPAIARELWSHGRHPSSVSRRLGMPTARVQAVRTALGTDLATALDRGLPRRSSGGKTLANNKFSACIELLARGRPEEARRLVARASSELREELEEQDLLLEPHAAQIAAVHPEFLAEAYSFLLEADNQETERASAAARHAGLLQHEASGHLAQAFDALLAGLPRDLVDWPRLLPRDAVGKFDTTVPERAGEPGSPHAEALRQYGLAPQSFVGIARSLQLQFDAIRTHDTVPAFFADDDAPDAPEPSDGPVSLGFGQLVACVRAAPHVPGHGSLVHALARWTLDVVAERPYFVPGYASDLSTVEPDTLVSVPRAAKRVTGAQDLRALWISPRAGGLKEVVGAW